MLEHRGRPRLNGSLREDRFKTVGLCRKVHHYKPHNKAYDSICLQLLRSSVFRQRDRFVTVAPEHRPMGRFMTVDPAFQPRDCFMSVGPEFQPRGCFMTVGPALQQSFTRGTVSLPLAKNFKKRGTASSTLAQCFKRTPLHRRWPSASKEGSFL